MEEEVLNSMISIQRSSSSSSLEMGELRSCLRRHLVRRWVEWEEDVAVVVEWDQEPIHLNRCLPKLWAVWRKEPAVEVEVEDHACNKWVLACSLCHLEGQGCNSNNFRLVLDKEEVSNNSERLMRVKKPSKISMLRMEHRVIKMNLLICSSMDSAKVMHVADNKEMSRAQILNGKPRSYASSAVVDASSCSFSLHTFYQL